jgi:hypothetical protein
MLDPGTYTATLDRIEGTPGGDLAVLVIERDGDPVSQLDLPLEAVPDDGRHADAVFEVVVGSDRFALTHRPDETERRAAAAQSRFDRLARRPPSRDAADAAVDEPEAASDDDLGKGAEEETGEEVERETGDESEDETGDVGEEESTTDSESTSRDAK